ncbi:hypothetical protein [Autumnicola musiva]|uniref:Uncharacterized protein n=1 Tax=Autumnicola musiva TaxID=3075589 RepID=A0ABU3D2Q0_9FLAO|nr:hypothetical protein [Zunongwangia sp. F117]MDT0675803.1 hypothetical protein [Zunongwangia sp. F117]
MKKLFTMALCLFIPGFLMAQNKDLEREIKNYSDSKSQLISRGRKLLLDTFLEGNISKVRDVKDYLLNEVEDEDYAALYPGEEWTILYWTGEYYGLISAVTDFDENNYTEYQRKVLPPQDQLYLKLLERSMDSIEFLENKILSSDINEEEKDFLLLHLNYMVSGPPLNEISQEEVNKMADLYLEKHPSGRFQEYVQNNIRYRFKASNWGFAFDFFLGYQFLTGEISNMFGNGMALGHGFDLEYKDFTLFLRNFIGFSKTLEDIENSSGIWNKGAQARQFIPELSLGYAILDNEKLKVSPFAGIGGYALTPTEVDREEKPELDDLQIGFVTAYTLGVNADIKLKWGTGLLLETSSNNKTYWFLRGRYGYVMPRLGDYPDSFHGNTHYFTLGIGGVFRTSKRDL